MVSSIVPPLPRHVKAWTTHIPLLLRAVQATTGPVLELGVGLYSTPLLHWLCAEARRPLTSYEDDPPYAAMAAEFQSRTHRISLVRDWDSLDLRGPWSVALVDHGADRRAVDAIRLAHCAEYVVLHDTDQRCYGYEAVWPHFAHVYHWRYAHPWTSLVSNHHPCEELCQYQR